MRTLESIDRGWSEVEFKGLSLGDKRLEARLRLVSEQLSSKLQSPIYDAAGDWKSAKAAYRLFDNEKVTAEKILQPHLEQTLSRVCKEEVILAIQDTTFFNFSQGKKGRGLGPIGDSGSKAEGLILHHTLAVSSDGLPLGVLTQKLWVREGFNQQTDQERWATPIEEKESYRWIEALRETHRLAPQSTKVITVCDREADIYEFLQEASLLGSQILIRASANRRLNDSDEEHFFDRLKTLPLVGSIEVLLQQHEHRGRKVMCDVRLGAVTLAPPDRPGKSSLTPLTYYGILVTEQNPTDKDEPLEWKLITNIPTTSFDEAVERVRWYRLRWQIEVLHRILKTGCDVEGCLLEARDRIVRYVVLFSIIAWRIFWLTHIARVHPNAPALTVISKQELDVLRTFTKPNPSLKNDLSTAKEVVLAVAMLGGFLNRKNDGRPGPTPIWRGWQLLQQLAFNLNKIEAKKVFATYG
jgi:hypothetical protein